MDNASDTMRHLFAPFQNIDGRYVSRNLFEKKMIEFLEEHEDKKTNKHYYSKV